MFRSSAIVRRTLGGGFRLTSRMFLGKCGGDVRVEVRNKDAVLASVMGGIPLNGYVLRGGFVERGYHRRSEPLETIPLLTSDVVKGGGILFDGLTGGSEKILDHGRRKELESDTQT